METRATALRAFYGGPVWKSIAMPRTQRWWIRTTCCCYAPLVRLQRSRTLGSQTTSMRSSILYLRERDGSFVSRPFGAAYRLAVKFDSQSSSTDLPQRFDPPRPNKPAANCASASMAQWATAHYLRVAYSTLRRALGETSRSSSLKRSMLQR